MIKLREKDKWKRNLSDCHFERARGNRKMTNMELDLHGLFEQNSTLDYGDNYEYKEEDISQSSSRFMTVFMPVLYSVVLALGLLGNGLVLAVLFQKRRTWCVTDVFVLNLSVANLLLLSTVVLWAVDAAKGWVFGGGLCKVAGALFKICFYCGIFLLTCISLDRYFFVTRTVPMFSRLNLGRVYFSCLAVWTLSLLLAVPDWIYLDSIPGDKPECLHCYPCKVSRLTSRLFHHVLGFLLPLVMLLSCSVRVLIRPSQDVQKPVTQNRRAAYVVLALVLAFLVSWTPYNVALLEETAKHKSAGRVCVNSGWSAVKITAILGLLHSCCNPLIYVVFSGKFRLWALNVARFKGCAVGSGDFFPWDCRADEASPGEQQVKDDVL